MAAGRVAVITGAAGGLGAAVARRFYSAGDRLALVDRDHATLAALELALRAEDVTAAGRICSYVVDVTDETMVADAYRTIGAELGVPDTLFNNAGIEGSVQPITDYPTEMFDRVMNINVRGVWLNLKYALRAMSDAGKGGAIINTASGAALVGNRDSAPYSASKHAVLGLTRSAALEVAARGIRVNAVCPGPIDTRMMRSIEQQSGLPDADIHRAIVAGIPAGRYGTVEEVAALVFFLASDAARYINGAGISIDGGLTAM